MRAVNLIPAEKRESRSGVANRSQGAAFVVLALFVAVAALGYMYGSAHETVQGKESEAAQVEAQARKIQAQASSLAPYTSFIALREEREQAIVGLINSRFDWSHFLAQLGYEMPPGTTVDSFQGSAGSTQAESGAPSSGKAAKNSSPVRSATPAGSLPAVTISGCATNQKTLALLLTKLRLIDGVTYVELHSDSAGAGGGGGGSAGGCGEHQVSYQAAMSFEALPAAPTRATSLPSGSTVSATATGGSAASTSAAAAHGAAASASNTPAVPR